MRIESVDLRRKKKASRWLLWVNVFWAAALVGTLVYQYWLVQAEKDEELLAPRVQEATAHQQATPLRAAGPATHLAASNVPNPVFDWDTALLALETVEVEGVTVSSFWIDAKQEEMALALSFTDYRALSTYHSRLNEQLTAKVCEVRSAAMMPSTSAGQGTVVCRWR